MKYKFPRGFLWGTATAAHQIEGNNINSDWWHWEQEKNYQSPEREFPLEPSGIACDSYNRYEEDFDLCQQLNNNAVRISVEWARIEPQEGVFDEKEVAHYKEVLKAAKRRNLKTFVTLHHFTNPLWFAEKGGWSNRKSADYFRLYSKKVAEELGDYIDTFITINEPQVYTLMSYTNGTWYPAQKNLINSLYVQINMMRAHKKAYASIKSVDSNYPVSIVKNIVWYETKSHVLDKIYVKFLNFLGGDFFLIPIKKQLDVLGLNFYFTTHKKNFKTANLDDVNSDLGWWVEPKGLENVLVNLKKYKVPIYVTENGCADATDRIREDFIKGMLISCVNAIEKGVDLKGYFHWSLLDNYEWHQGFWPKFGLVEIDRNNNLKRILRKSFFYYAEICKNNSVEDQTP